MLLWACPGSWLFWGSFCPSGLCERSGGLFVFVLMGKVNAIRNAYNSLRILSAKALFPILIDHNDLACFTIAVNVRFIFHGIFPFRPGHYCERSGGFYSARLR